MTDVFVFKPPTIRSGDEYTFKGKRYVVKSIAKNGKTVWPVKGLPVNRRDVYKNRVAYVPPPGYAHNYIAVLTHTLMVNQKRFWVLLIINKWTSRTAHLRSPGTLSPHPTT